MGASGWWYRCRYRADVAVVLGELQESVLLSGDYLKAWEGSGVVREARAAEFRMVVETVPDEFPVDVYERAAIDRLAGGGEPETIDQARAWAMHDGTHSILDIDGVSESPADGCVSPLTESELMDLFGTSRPSVELIESRKDAAMSSPMDSWSGRYVVGYEKGSPAAIFFFGYSGD